jgi:hypothetical protein
MSNWNDSNKFKKVAKQKKLGIVLSGTFGLTLRDEITSKNHFHLPSTLKQL